MSSAPGPPCQLEGALRPLAAAVAVCPEKRTPFCEQAHVGGRPRQVRHVSLKLLAHLQAAAVAVCRFSQSRFIKQA